jgi:hypothetical protein
MDRDRIERLIGPARAQHVVRPADEPALKRLRTIAGPISVARRPISVDERRAVRLAGSIAGGKGTIGSR